MKIILIENVPSLGKAGDLVQVAPGYGRNYLIPKKQALEASPANIKLLERQKQLFLQKAGNEKQRAVEMAAQIGSLPCTLSRPVGESEKLFGSVTSQMIADSLKEKGFNLDKRIIDLEEPIKALGIYNVNVKLHQNITGKVKVWVVRE